MVFIFVKIGIIKIHMASHKTVTRKEFILLHLVSALDLSHVVQLSKAIFLIQSLLFVTLVECLPWRRKFSTVMQRPENWTSECIMSQVLYSYKSL